MILNGTKNLKYFVTQFFRDDSPFDNQDISIRSLYYTLRMASWTVISGSVKTIVHNHFMVPSTCLKFLCQHLEFEHHGVLSKTNCLLMIYLAVNSVLGFCFKGPFSNIYSGSIWCPSLNSQVVMKISWNTIGEPESAFHPI